MSKETSFVRQLAICALIIFCCANDGWAQSGKSTQNFPLERDHIFIWVTQGAPEAAKLQELGLYTDGKIHKHGGQGTASKVFVFENAYLELIWIDEPAVAQGKTEAMNTNIVERAGWRKTGASPFGIGLHHRVKESVVPFPTKKYWAEWMKPDTFIAIAESATDVKEPFVFVVPEYLRAPTIEQVEQLTDGREEIRRIFNHQLGVHKLTAITITSKVLRLSKTTSLLSENHIVSISRGNSSYAELWFDNGAQGKTLDVRPSLPIVLKY